MCTIERPIPTDSRGFEVFSKGERGRAHVAAHRLLDAGKLARGRALLGRWLRDHEGEGGQWVHLQWHMLVFELADDDWRAAYARYQRAIAPIASESAEASTDAPQALLRLCWAAPDDARLAWDAIAQPAIDRLEQPGSAFRILHDLVSVAGAHELDAIDRWLTRRAAGAPRGLEEAARGVRAFATRDDRVAVAMLQRALPELESWGGSRAQNELFAQMLRVAERRIATATPFRGSECLSPPTVAQVSLAA